MRHDVILKWSKRDKDIKIEWTEGAKYGAYLLLSGITNQRMHFNWEKRLPEFDPSIQEKLESMGFDITTLKITISKKAECQK